MSHSAAEWVPPGLAQLFEIVLDAAGRGGLDEAERQQFESAAAGAADTGASLSVLIDAYLRGAGELWENLFIHTTGTTPTVQLGRTLRQISEQAVGALAEGFEAAQRRNIRAEETARRELIDALLVGGPIDPLWFDDRARTLGFPAEGPYQVAVCSPDDMLGDVDDIEVDVLHHLEGTFPGRGWVSVIRRGQLVVIASGARSAELASVIVVLAADPSRRWTVGIGDARGGPDGVQASYRQAAEAQRIGQTFGLGAVTVYAEVLVERLLSGHRPIVNQLHAEVVAPLEEATRGDLLETLEVFLATGGNTAEVARQISVGTRTVGYRLDRIEEVTGYAPRNPEHRLLLELAMRGRPLIAEP
jgi:PucR C-terminal helix-turn-helix domain/GGDEF-like domain